MKKYFIVADGGGTKLDIILYDDDFNIVKTVRGKGVNENKKDLVKIKEEVFLLVENLLSGTGITEIEKTTVSLASKNDFLYDAVKKFCALKEYEKYNEGQSVLYASGVNHGVVVQAGTGSDVFVCMPNFSKIFGGLGHILGDEGSGFDIGLKSIKSAIEAYENRGEQTILQQMIFEKFNIVEPRDFIKNLVLDKDFLEKIASVTYITEKAVNMKDSVAINIYKNAGKVLAEQTIYAIQCCIEKERIDRFDGVIVPSGGAWKGAKIMQETFTQIIKDKFPFATIKKPLFKPVVGLVIANYLQNGGVFDKILPILETNFKEYLYE